MPQMKRPGIVPMPPDFENVVLSQEEIDLAMFEARCEKYWRLKELQAKEEAERLRTEARMPFTAEQLQEFVLKQNPWFRLDDQVRPYFEMLSYYFAGDRRFEKDGRSLSKGICLSGPVGVGKTELLNIFRINKRQCFHMVSVFDIETALQKNLEQINAYCGPVPGWGHNKRFFYQPEIGWAFDDVGRESIIFDFGNKVDAISKILQLRYAYKVKFSGLHITTNKPPAELEKRYDEAVRSRLREMFNYIHYSGEDRRK